MGAGPQWIPVPDQVDKVFQLVYLAFQQVCLVFLALPSQPVIMPYFSNQTYIDREQKVLHTILGLGFKQICLEDT